MPALPKMGNWLYLNFHQCYKCNMSSKDDWLSEGFGEIFPSHVSAFTDFMIALRRDFEGDLDMMIVLAVIGERRFSRSDPTAELQKADLGSTPMREGASRSINAHSIAEYSGIARETVRRKVAWLIEKGWVERDDNGDLRPTAKAAAELSNATDATLVYLRKVVDACDKARKLG
jgi:hypothetical protein